MGEVRLSPENTGLAKKGHLTGKNYGTGAGNLIIISLERLGCPVLSTS
jgi:hypothetical protein